jgi:hypothetical protein
MVIRTQDKDRPHQLTEAWTESEEVAKVGGNQRAGLSIAFDFDDFLNFSTGEKSRKAVLSCGAEEAKVSDDKSKLANAEPSAYPSTTDAHG